MDTVSHHGAAVIRGKRYVSVLQGLVIDHTEIMCSMNEKGIKTAVIMTTNRLSISTTGRSVVENNVKQTKTK